MRRLLLISFLISALIPAQISNHMKAPNSYVYDVALADSGNYGGIMIPVKKAYEMWANYQYLKTNNLPTPIPAGVQSAAVHWEDVPGLISEVTVLGTGNPADSKIKVAINSSKGKGNAVVTFKVNGTVYWSWHIWVTDNPSNGVVYQHSHEADAALAPIQVKYMDRNLGAVSNTFLGNKWEKSGGLMYEWGRKDPFPPLVYKDLNFYEISGEAGVLKHKQVDAVNTIPVKVREFNEIEKNIQYSVKNPLTYIINTDDTGNWFSSSRYKVAAASPDYVTWDLWSDNAKGGNSNANSSNTVLKNESRSYDLKSELDPCPNGWRIPSYYGRETQNNNLSPWGRQNNWNNDDITVHKNLLPTSQNAYLDGIKVYPGLGMDFTNAAAGSRNMGIMPVSGTYVYYPNTVAPNAPVGVIFQDNNANGGLWSSTYGYDGARLLTLISDPFRNNTSVGLHSVYQNQTNPSKAGNAVRCMQDPNLLQIGDFVTEYFQKNYENYTKGIDDPNSYVVKGNIVKIPVNKAFSVYNQHLSDHGMLPSDRLVSKVLWATNPNLIKKLTIEKNLTDPRNSEIIVELNKNERGNAVISLHNKNTKSPSYWSWHIWSSEEDPEQNTVTYTTEVPVATPYNFINPTVSKLPPLSTTFMDRNLGAKSGTSNENGNAVGLHYQWGRKDPIPTFNGGSEEKPIFIGSENTTANGILNYFEVSASNYTSSYTVPYSTYASANPVNHVKIRENIRYSVQNPLKFLYQQNLGMLYDGGNHYANDLSKIRDWVSNNRSQADNRWGHADKKSPFDPCPAGWRVPDVSLTNLYTSSKGNSPWFNGYHADAYGNPGVIQDQWHDISTYYQGAPDGSQGWNFQNTPFKIGYFPKDGIRGELGENQITYNRSGVWTASLADLNTGFGLAMQFQGTKMQTAAGAYPQAGMGVRCAKDENRLLGAPYVAPPLKTSQEVMATAADIKPATEIYPNPFTTELNVTDKDALTFEMYDFSGRIMLKGAVTHGKINTAALQKGIYICKINMKDGTFVTKKVIRN